MKKYGGKKKTITVKSFFKEDGAELEKLIKKSLVLFVKSEAAKEKN